MIGLLGRDDWSVRDQREVNPGVRDQVGLELRQIHVQSTVETEGGSNRRDDLTDQTVKVCVGWSLNVQVTTADIVDGFIVDHEGAVGMFQSRVRGEDGIVWLNNSSRDLRCWVDGELKL